MQNKININLKFKEYEFRRVKRMGENPVIYTDAKWIGEVVLIIPVPINVTDRWIERQRDYDEINDEMVYDITFESDTILKKIVGSSRTVGRVYVPKELLGLDCIIIKAPFLDDF